MTEPLIDTDAASARTGIPATTLKQWRYGARVNAAADSYLDLLARALTRFGMEQEYRAIRRPSMVQAALAKRGLALARHTPFDAEAREVGRDWPAEAETMVGLRRLANIRHCVEQILAGGVPGDFLETGVWRGGASIYLAGVLAAHQADRQVWLADSFEGLPPPDVARYGKDVADLSGFDYLAVTVENVRANFEKYHLLGDNIHFVKGWFADTMPTATIEHLALLRLDGDLYSSTMDVLVPMYDKVSPGGFVIVDDYGALAECEQAVTDFRRERGISDEIIPIDWCGAYWRKT
jgi:O-methyltransferase